MTGILLEEAVQWFSTFILGTRDRVNSGEGAATARLLTEHLHRAYGYTSPGILGQQIQINKDTRNISGEDPQHG